MTESVESPPSLYPWWKSIRLDVGECLQYTIGPITLYFRREEKEWLFAFERQPGNDEGISSLGTSPSCLPEQLMAQRFIFRESPQAFCLQPVLLDRPVVVRTRQAVRIPPGEETVFYISSPVCVRMSLQQPDCFLHELPIRRLSDTWFGPSTSFGELCYADRTHARHTRAEVPLRPHRAVTPVTIVNRSNVMLTIDKLSIPVPYLAVYGLPDGTLWTDTVALEHDGKQALTRFRVESELPEGVEMEHRLAGPRRQVERHGLIRAFTGIFND